MEGVAPRDVFARKRRKFLIAEELAKVRWHILDSLANTLLVRVSKKVARQISRPDSQAGRPPPDICEETHVVPAESQQRGIGSGGGSGYQQLPLLILRQLTEPQRNQGRKIQTVSVVLQ